MSYTATLPPVHQPLEAGPFLEYVQAGLFAAPWLERPDPREIVAVQKLSRNLAHTTAPDDLVPVLGQLLEVRSLCLLAASSQDPIPARARYQDALTACVTALNHLHHATTGQEGALAAWALGVHNLIRAQLALPDLAESERLARAAMIALSGIDDPLCAGAEADAHAATLLAWDPPDLTRKLQDLPDQVLAKIEYYRYETDRQETVLNDRLTGVVQAHGVAFRSVAGWFALNLVLMATLPLNGALAPDVPWSLPFMVCVPILWWLTWDRPYRESLLFFDWIRTIKEQSLAQFHEAHRHLVHPQEQFRQSVAGLLRQARADRERLAAFHLFDLPSSVDTVDDAVTIADEGRVILAGDWMIELNDTSPWRLDEALTVEPTVLPRGYRIYFQSDAK